MNRRGFLSRLIAFCMAALPWAASTPPKLIHDCPVLVYNGRRFRCNVVRTKEEIRPFERWCRVTIEFEGTLE